MGILARCALVVLVWTGATTAGLRQFSPTDTPNFRAVVQSEQIEGTPFYYDWTPLPNRSDHQAVDRLLTDHEFIAMLLSTWRREPMTPPADDGAAESTEDKPDDLDNRQSALRETDDVDMTYIVLDDVFGDGAVEDESPFVTLGESGFDDLELVTRDDDEDTTRRDAGADGDVRHSVGQWGGHRMPGMPGGGVDPARARASELGFIAGGYFLDWPWSVRQGRNMFYWLVGPPALVFFVVGVMGIASEMGSRSS